MEGAPRKPRQHQEVLIHLVRHAQSVANALDPHHSPAAPIDCAITELGLRQAEAVADHLAGVGIDLVLSSPYLRTLQTADAVRVRCGVPARVIPLLHEHHMIVFPSQWPLMSRERLRTSFPHFEVADDFVDANWFQPPEGDDQALARARRVLAWIFEEFRPWPDARIAVVSHGSPVGKLLLAFLDVQTSESLSVTIENASLTTLELSGSLRLVHSVNRVDHLAW